MLFLWIAIGVLIIGGSYLFMINPRVGKDVDMSAFEETLIAHRGYFNNESDSPENSMAAFGKAVENGYGIELDVQLSKDHKLVVFHDNTLTRMCGAEKKVSDCTYEELQQYSLAKSEQKIPLFTEVLELVNGKVPLVVEVKPDGEYIEATKMMYEQIKDYKGIYCMESFHPMAVAWFKKHAPHVVRGQLSMDYFVEDPGRSLIQKVMLSNLMLNWLARPQFIAYNHKQVNQKSYALCRKISRVKNVAWTIRSQEELEKAKEVFTVMIFDSFKPE